MLFLEFQISVFFGRFHPLIVHLPIGFIYLAVFLEIVGWKKKVDLEFSIKTALLLGGVFGLISVILGLLLADSGGYNLEMVDRHKWFGFATTILAFASYLVKKRSNNSPTVKKAYPWVLILLISCLTITGHYGGSLTHGSTYLLEYAPQGIRSLAGLKPARERITSLDSAVLYLDVIHPIFENKCLSCHNSEKAKGELVLSNQAGILKGGENGNILKSSTDDESELIRRLTLNPNHDDFMPAEGKTPLTSEETALVDWWVNLGGPFDTKIVEHHPTERILGYLRIGGIGAKPSFLASLELPAVSAAHIASIKKAGFQVQPIASGSTLLEISFPVYKDSLTMEKLLSLGKAKENIAWLSLQGTSLDDEGLSVVGKFTNLVNLKISNTKISDGGVIFLEGLSHLESLNIYGTSVSDKSVQSLSKLSNLKSLYLWQTDITDEGINTIKSTQPQVEIVSGYTQ